MIKRGALSDFFQGVAAKRLSAVETRGDVSNQHEFNGSGALRQLFGDEDRRDMDARFIWLGEQQDALTVEGKMSWYDARRRHPTRSEYRLYYRSNTVTEMMNEDDLFFLAICKNGDVLAIIVPAGGTIQNQIMWLFGLDANIARDFIVRDISPSDHDELDFAARYILDELGIDLPEPDAGRLDELIEPFGLMFPKTRELSQLARRSLSGVDAVADPDQALVLWMEREEQLFKRLERRIVDARLRAGFISADTADIDGFLAYSLSVQNRRKSRAGHALENHLEALFLANNLRFVRGAETENKNKPDFFFPGQAEYRDPGFTPKHLVMLGAKSTLKDRWRQVLSEAERITEKHLLTLEPGVSENQTREMQAKHLKLVVPSAVQKTYTSAQQSWLSSVADFIRFVKTTQPD